MQREIIKCWFDNKCRKINRNIFASWLFSLILYFGVDALVHAAIFLVILLFRFLLIPQIALGGVGTYAKKTAHAVKIKPPKMIVLNMFFSCPTK